MRSPIGVLIVDDHAIVREGLRRVLSEEKDVEVIGEAATGDEALAVAIAQRPDVVLMDLVMPGLDGLVALRRIREAEPRIQILVLTSFSDEKRVSDAIAAGAVGYLLKDMLKSEILRAVRNAVQGIPSLHPEAQRHLMQRVRRRDTSLEEILTAREIDVLRCLARGRNNRAIARELRLSEGTVKGYVSVILQKLNVEDRTQAALLAVRRGLAPLED